MSADRITAIKARLAAATPGSWEVEQDIPARGDIPESCSVIAQPYERVAESSSLGDADLIANAPEDLQWLLGEVERLERDEAAALGRLQWMTEQAMQLDDRVMRELNAYHVCTDREYKLAQFASGVFLAPDMDSAMRLAESALGGRATSGNLIGQVRGVAGDAERRRTATGGKGSND